MSTELSLVILGIFLFIIIVIFNSLVSKKNEVKNAFATMDTMLKKRFDLIPNFVAAVKEFMKHERATLEEVTKLRAEALAGSHSEEQTKINDAQLSRAMKGIMVAVENYPQLKSNANFLQLQTTLNVTEEEIAAARRTYNSVVTNYNKAIEMFPTNFFALIMGFKKKDLFEISDEERRNVSVGALFKDK